VLFANVAPLIKKHCHFPAASKDYDFCEARDFQELSQHVDVDITAEACCFLAEKVKILNCTAQFHQKFASLSQNFRLQGNFTTASQVWLS